MPNNITRKANAEQWQSRQRTGRGGGREYAYNSLPKTTQTALIYNSGQIVDVYTEPSIGSPKVRPQVQHVKPTSEQRIDAWLLILRAYEHWCACHHNFETMLERDTAFVRAYNDRQLVLVNWVYAYLPKLSRSTLKAKQKLRREAPTISALGGNYGHRRGTGRIDSDPDLPAAIETCLAAGGKHWGASQIYDILQLEFGLDPETCSLGQVQAWLRQFRERRPQEWAMYMSPDRVKGTVSPAIQAVTAAITESESRPDLEPPAIELEQYHQELKRLEAESERQLLVQEQQQSRQYGVEKLINCWQQQQTRPVLEASELELLMQHLSLPEGSGFLAAVTSSSQEERQFFDWLMGRVAAQVTVVDRRPLLQEALARWRDRQSLSPEDKQSLLYYIQEPEGLGVLKAYTSSEQEQQFQTWLIDKF